jgi:hypothetical protein
MRQRPAPPRRLAPAGTGIVLLMVIGAGTAGVAVSTRYGQASAAPPSSFVPIQQVAPNVQQPPVTNGGSSGAFVVDCGTNGNRKLSPDNPVAQPGIRNGAQHVHDFVGNLSISADSSDASLEDSGTTCRNGDKSSYFWPVVRIDRQSEPVGATTRTLRDAGTPAVSCPAVGDRMPAVPAQARAVVNQDLDLLDRQIAEANQRLISEQGKISPDFVNNAILGPLRDKRTAALDRIATAIGRTTQRPANLLQLAGCDLSYDGAHKAHGQSAGKRGVTVTPAVSCPTVRGQLPGVPAAALAEVNRNLDLFDRQIAEANQRLVTTQSQGAAGDDAVLGQLRGQRTAALDRIATAIGRSGTRPTGLQQLAPCTMTNAGTSTGSQDDAGQSSAAPSSAAPSSVAPSGAGQGGDAEELPGAVGPDLEVAGNVGGIVQPKTVKIEYRGSATNKVVAMPKFLKAITGDAKPTSRGPANARPSWTCSGFPDRLASTYVICPEGSQVMRVHDFPGCWDGKNTDSADHRSHVAFADAGTGACPGGFRAIPQLRISISYAIPADVQRNGQYQLDSFPEENHNPFSDHDDFANVNSEKTMNRIVTCINSGRSCR